MRILVRTKDLADVADNEVRMSTDKKEKMLSRDQPIDRPKDVSDEDFRLFQARRRAERLQVDLDEQRVTRQGKTKLTAEEFKRSG
jgi:hypothetical protein